MDEGRTLAAVKTIARRQRALAWLTEHGAKFTGRSDDREGEFSFDLFLAGSCAGAEEAIESIEAYARVHLPDIIKSATESCRNDIGIALSIIREETEKA